MAVFKGVDPSSQRSGAQARREIEALMGRAWTDTELADAYKMIPGYTDTTGAAMLGGGDYNTLLKAASGQTPGSTFEDWTDLSFDGLPTPVPFAPEPTTPFTPTPAPNFTAPRRRELDAFVPGTFTAPTRENMQVDPSYTFRFDEGMRGLENSAAGRGALRAGNTFKDFIGYGQGAASQEYGNIYARAADTFDRNERGRVQGRGFDMADADAAYGSDLTGAQLEYAPGLLSWENQNRWGELNFDRDWQRELATRDDDWRKYVFGKDDEFRRSRAGKDDEQWLQDFEESRRRFLAELGAR